MHPFPGHPYQGTKRLRCPCPGAVLRPPLCRPPTPFPALAYRTASPYSCPGGSGSRGPHRPRGCRALCYSVQGLPRQERVQERKGWGPGVWLLQQQVRMEICNESLKTSPFSLSSAGTKARKPCTVGGGCFLCWNGVEEDCGNVHACVLGVGKVIEEKGVQQQGTIALVQSLCELAQLCL
eukprot:1157362-Pelagomonas_calceolata.AAC.12